MSLALSHYGYNYFSFILVAEVSSLTYSIGNSVKRLVTIYGSVIYFRNHVSTLNLVASLVAVAGVALYSSAITSHLLFTAVVGKKSV